MNKPTLTIMVGIPGCGKSTAAQQQSKDLGDVLLSSDELRAVVGKDESDQSVSGKVFEIMETMAAYFLRRGQSVIIDATNTSKRARLPFVLIGRKYGALVEARFVHCPPNIAKERNAKRARVVPDHVIDRMAERLEIPVEGDGEFDVVYFDENRY